MTQTVNDRSFIAVATTAGQTVYGFDFQALAASHVSASFNDVSAGTTITLTQGVDFSVQGVGLANGGTITLLASAPTAAVGDRVTIFGSIPIERPNDYQQSGDFLAATVNDEEDTQIQIMQELRRDIDRSVRLPIGSTPPEITIGEENETLIFDANGNLIGGPTVGEIEGAASAADRAEAAVNQIEALTTSVEGFGAVSDMGVTLVGDGTGPNDGYVRSGGTNNHTAFRRAIEHSIASNVVVLASGNYYIKSFDRFTLNGSQTVFPVGFDTNVPADVQGYLTNLTGGAITVLNNGVDFTVGNGQITTTVEHPATHNITFFCPLVWGGAIVSGNKRKNFIWNHYNALDAGGRVSASGTILGARLIGQYDRGPTPKPDDTGHLGAVLLMGDYLRDTAQERVGDCVIDVDLCRAASTATQESDKSYLFERFGYVEDNDITLGLHGHSNTPSNGLEQAHWGGRIVPGFVLGEDNLTDAEVLEQYVPVGNRVRYRGIIDGSDDGHGFDQARFFSATGEEDIGQIHVQGCRPGDIQVGDEVDHLVIAAQRGRAFKANKIGFMHVTGVPVEPSNLVNMSSRGTDKQDDFPGTSRKIIRQRPIYPRFEGMYAEATEGTAVAWATGTAFARNDLVTEGGIRYICTVAHTSGVFADDLDDVPGNPPKWEIYSRAGFAGFGAEGDINLGDLWITGCVGGPVENRFGASNVQYKLHNSDRPIVHQQVLGGRVLASGVDLGTEQAPEGNGDLNRGWDANNGAAYVRGAASVTAATTEARSEGDVTTAVTAIPQDVHVGTIARLEGTAANTFYDVTITEFADNQTFELAHSPLPDGAAVSSGATVTFPRKARLDEFVGTFRSSENGLVIDYAEVYRADLSKVAWSGRHAAWLTNDSLLDLGGKMPTTVGRVGNADTIRVDAGCHVDLRGMTIPHNPNVQSHLFLNRDSPTGPFGTATFHGCRIENQATVARGNTLLEQALFIGCVDFDGNPLPERIGDQNWTPSILIGGSAAGITYGSRTGNFMLITNQMVWITFDITLTNDGGLIGAVTLADLPFAQRTNDDAMGPLQITNYSGATNGLTLIGQNNAFTMQRQSSSVSSVQGADIANNSRFKGAIQYRRA